MRLRCINCAYTINIHNSLEVTGGGDVYRNVVYTLAFSLVLDTAGCGKNLIPYNRKADSVTPATSKGIYTLLSVPSSSLLTPGCSESCDIGRHNGGFAPQKKVQVYTY